MENSFLSYSKKQIKDAGIKSNIVSLNPVFVSCVYIGLRTNRNIRQRYRKESWVKYGKSNPALIIMQAIWEYYLLVD